MRTTEFYINHDHAGAGSTLLPGSPLRSPKALTSTIRATAWWSSACLRPTRPQQAPGTHYNMHSPPSERRAEMRVHSLCTAPITASLPAILSPRDLARGPWDTRLTQESKLSPRAGWRAHDLPLLHQFSDLDQFQSPRIKAEPVYAARIMHASPRYVTRALHKMNAWSPRRSQRVRQEAVMQMRQDIDVHARRVTAAVQAARPAPPEPEPEEAEETEQIEVPAALTPVAA